MTNIFARTLSFSIAVLISSLGFSSEAASIPEEFWKTIDTISESAPKGIKTMADSWPNKSLLTHIENSKDLKNIKTEPFEISKDIQAKSAEIRVSEQGAIRLLTLGI